MGTPDGFFRMSAAADTLTAARRMENAGVARDDLATKSDLADLKADLEGKISALEVRLIKWAVGLAGIVVAAIKLIPGP